MDEIIVDGNLKNVKVCYVNFDDGDKRKVEEVIYFIYIILVKH